MRDSKDARPLGPLLAGFQAQMAATGRVPLTAADGTAINRCMALPIHQIQVATRVDPETYKTLLRIAEDQERSLSYLLRHALEEVIADAERKVSA